jgi:DUF3860-like
MTAHPDDLRLLRQIVEQGGRKYTAGNIDRRKYQRLVALDWLTETSVNISDVLYKVTDAGKWPRFEKTEIPKRLPPACAAQRCSSRTMCSPQISGRALSAPPVRR